MAGSRSASPFARVRERIAGPASLSMDRLRARRRSAFASADEASAAPTPTIHPLPEEPFHPLRPLGAARTGPCCSAAETDIFGRAPSRSIGPMRRLSGSTARRRSARRRCSAPASCRFSRRRPAASSHGASEDRRKRTGDRGSEQLDDLGPGPLGTSRGRSRRELLVFCVKAAGVHDADGPERDGRFAGPARRLRPDPVDGDPRGDRGRAGDRGPGPSPTTRSIRCGVD